MPTPLLRLPCTCTFRIVTMSVAPAETVIPFVPDDHHRGNSTAAAVDGDRLGNGHRAKTAGVKRVDFSARRRLRNGAGEGQARSRSAARIGVVTDTRYPRSRRLGVSRNRAKHGLESRPQDSN